MVLQTLIGLGLLINRSYNEIKKRNYEYGPVIRYGWYYLNTVGG